ncbi:hypothetical protein SAMN05421505_14931 [Sinosporangium album]|uniref:Uncharacterized protein n=1 Tax=Sinosporangium album TaxID=504805 RepID=A0A1G8KCH5_9ACTN|nr:hypothetical protein [Sinosporangium album]SDI41111.1 hypothetical protein SAMN05421505_14931 [Sinosporangium album]
MSGHAPDCWRDPAHHVCAAAAAARAEGERDEARRAAAEAYQRLAGHEALLIETAANRVADQLALDRVAGLLAAYRADLETKGIEWHPRFRSAVEKVIDQLGGALHGGREDASASTAAAQRP